MKVLTTTGLTKLIELSKGTFLDKNNVVDVSSALATVATTGSYTDLSDKPTIPTVDQTYSASSTNAQSGTAVASAISNKVDKVSTASKAYGTDGSGNQTTYSVEAAATQYTIPYRNAGGVLNVGTPTADAHATTKKYVDDSVAAVIPSQTGNSGKYLTTNGTAVSWATVDALPSQTGNSGKYLTTNGTTASWDALAAVANSGSYTDLSNKPTINDLTTAEQQAALNSGATSTNIAQITTNKNNISTINGKIPSAASSSNQLADKDFVNSSINAIAAYYITADAAGNAFATKAALDTGPYYHDGSTRTPTENDYAIVAADETHANACTRYSYTGSQWSFQYIVNDTPFTQAQIDAINSGINSTKVGNYDTHIADTDIHITTTDKNNWNAKQSAITGAASTVTSNDLTASRVLVSSSSGKIAASSNVTTTELDYLDGVTSAIQTQIDNKQATITGAATTITSSDLTASKALVSDSSGKVAASSVTSTELGYVSGVTSAIQTQLNNKFSANAIVQNLNNFTTKPKMWFSTTDNVLYSCDRRFTVTGSNFSSFSAARLFNGSYEDHDQCQVALGGTGTITITGSSITGTYRQGYMLISFYAGRGPANLSDVSVTIENSAGNVATPELSWESTNKWVIRATVVTLSTANAISKITINVTNNRTSGTVDVVEVEYFVSRPSRINLLPVVVKNANNVIYGSITADSLIKSGGTSSQFLKADGSTDSNTYATTTQLNSKQDTLVSGTNIKTINSQSILGSGNLAIDSLPSQTGQSGKYLTTDGSSASWADVDALPSQSGNSGKYLTTNGTTPSWVSLTIPTTTNAITSGSTAALTSGGAYTNVVTGVEAGTTNNKINVTKAGTTSTITINNVANATTASKLGSTTVGGVTQPIYLDSGTATALSYTIAKSVPADAVFTDHTYTNGAGINLTNGTTFSAKCDATTVSTNSSNQLQAIGVIDKKSSAAVYTWKGTKAEYNALGTYHNDWIYYLTDEGLPTGSDYYTKTQVDTMLYNTDHSITKDTPYLKLKDTNTNADIATVPSVNHSGGLIQFIDKNNQTSGRLYTRYTTDGSVKQVLQACKQVNGSEVAADVTVGVKADGTVFTTAPTPAASTSTSDSNIATVGWINDPNKATNVVHVTGNETILGAKTFLSNNTFAGNDTFTGSTQFTGTPKFVGDSYKDAFDLKNIDDSYTSPPAETISTNINITDVDGEYIGGWEHYHQADGTCINQIRVRGQASNDYATLAVGIDSEGHTYCTVPTDTYGTNFHGVSTRSQWADLAENYKSDEKYSIGTLIKFGGEKDITLADTEVNGVISDKPGYLLDADLKDGLPVALVGKTPIRIIGKVNRFDKITLSEIPGVGRVAKEGEKIIARALAFSNDENEKLVMCVTKFSLD